MLLQNDGIHLWVYMMSQPTSSLPSLLWDSLIKWTSVGRQCYAVCLLESLCIKRAKLLCSLSILFRCKDKSAVPSSCNSTLDLKIETLVPTYESTWCHSPLQHSHPNHHKNLKCAKCIYVMTHDIRCDVDHTHQGAPQAMQNIYQRQQWRQREINQIILPRTT
jgi:hypothetical protein